MALEKSKSLLFPAPEQPLALETKSPRPRYVNFIFFFCGFCMPIYLFSLLTPCILSLNSAGISLAARELRTNPRQDSISPTVTQAVSSTAAVLNVFQVSAPVLGPLGIISGNSSVNSAALAGCQVILMKHSFVNSFGKPFVGNYTPPSCIGNSNTVIMNFTVSSTGLQFDRLALMYLGDNEVFRTSTAEPKANGIVWEYLKDMSEYMSMWKLPQKVIFDLPNQVNSNLTGQWDTTIIVTFFSAPHGIKAADMIIPISARQGLNASAASVFSVPESNASITIAFPRNANRAVFSLSSCGQASEEFWWSNVFSSASSTFLASDGVIPGFSPFREVQLYIDGQLTGVQWPFPVIFTGGVVPGLWSPIVGIDAFDLKQYQIDITPWLPLLCDGLQHTFSMKVVGLNDDGGTSATISEAVGSSWLISGNIFIWLDDELSITTGTAPSISTPAPSIRISQLLTQNSTGANETLTYTINVQRSITVASMVKTQKRSLACTWTQTLSHIDQGTWLSFGNIQLNNITTTGVDTSTGPVSYSMSYNYPLIANSSFSAIPGGNSTVSASIFRSKTISTVGTSIYPSGLQPFTAIAKAAAIVPNLAGTTMSISENGSAALVSSPKLSTSFTFGGSQVQMRFGGLSGKGAMGTPDTELYFRSVRATNGTINMDMESIAGNNT